MVITIVIALVASVPAAWWSMSDDAADADTVVLESPGGSIALNRQSEGSLLATTALETLSGDVISSAALLGQPLVVNVWYSTCEPCRREFPVLAAAHERYGDEVRFVGENIGEDADDAAAFIAEVGATYDQFVDSDGYVVTELGTSTMPVTLVVDADGVIVREHLGPMDQDALNAAIDDALAATP